MFDTEADFERRAIDRSLAMVPPDGRKVFDLEWLTRNNCVAVPVESADHFAEEDLQSVLEMFTSAGVSEVVVVRREDDEPGWESPKDNETLVRQYVVSSSALERLDDDWSAMECVVLPVAAQWPSIMLTKDNYFVIAGERNLIEQAFGRTIEDMDWAFHQECVTGSGWLNRDRKLFKAIYEYCLEARTRVSGDRHRP